MRTVFMLQVISESLLVHDVNYLVNNVGVCFPGDFHALLTSVNEICCCSMLVIHFLIIILPTLTWAPSLPLQETD